MGFFGGWLSRLVGGFLGGWVCFWEDGWVVQSVGG